MRVWLGILVLAVLVTGGVAVYVVDHPPSAGSDAPGEMAPPQEEPPAEATPRVADLLAPTGLEPGIVPDNDPGSTRVRAPSLPPDGSDSGAGGAAGETTTEDASDAADGATGGSGTTGGTGTTGGSGATGGTTGGSGTTGGAGGGTGGTTGGTGGGTGGTGGTNEGGSSGGTGGGGSGGGTGGTGGGESGGSGGTTPPPPTPRTWTWVHDFAAVASPDPFDVQAGLRELEFKVVFAPTQGGVAAGAPVTANLVGPDSVVKVPCTSPAVLVGQHVCGPFRTSALAGRWEVQYTGTAKVEAAISLRELP